MPFRSRGLAVSVSIVDEGNYMSAINMTTRYTQGVCTVAPTETTVVRLTRDDQGVLKNANRVVLQIVNLDLIQTFWGAVFRSLDVNAPLAQSGLPDFSEIPPGGSVVADLQVDGSNIVELRGRMSGAGGDVAYFVNRKASI